MRKSKRKLIVPLVFGIYNYDSDAPMFDWIFEAYINYCLNNGMPIVAQENYFKKNINYLDSTYQFSVSDRKKKDLINKEKSKFLKYSIRNEETQMIIGNTKTRFKAEVDFFSKTNPKYISAIENRLDKIESDYKQKVDAIMIWLWNPSIEAIAKKRGITIIQQELSPIRKFHGNESYNTTLAYFQFKNKYDKDYCQNIYDEFLENLDKENIRIFSREELLALFLNTEDINYIKYIQDPPKYELGISPPIKDDFIFSVYKKEDTKETFKRIDKIFKPSNVSVRYRVSSNGTIFGRPWNIDNSTKPIYWVSSCKRILTYVSNIAFDAMMLGKTTYILSDYMPFSFKSNTLLKSKDESVVDSLFLNFIVFGYFTHWNLMFNQDYIEWRLSKPSIIEIYKYNKDYILKLHNLDEAHLTLENILRDVHNLNELSVREIVEYNPHKIFSQKDDAISKIEGDLLNIYNSKSWKILTKLRNMKRIFLHYSKKIMMYLKTFFINIIKDGPIITFKRILKRVKHVIEYRTTLRYERNPYKYWLRNNQISIFRRIRISKELRKLETHPLISIIMPVYNVDLKWIKKAINSINKQIYKNWELCIADDASTNPALIKYLERISKRKNIKVVFRKRNGHISEASNSALKLAKGEIIALMDNDDIIHPHALAEVVKVLNKDKDTDLIYSDEDKIDIKDKRMDPFFKPDWSPDLFMSTNYLCHLTVIRKNLVNSVKGFRKGYEGSQDYDLFLRIIEKTKNIKHIPDILYSWRKIPGSTAYEYKEKNYADNTSIKALEDYLKRNNIEGEVTTGLFPGSFRVRYKIIGEPLVSILIPTKDKPKYIKRCISSLLQKTTYQNYEILIIDTNSTDKETLEYYKTLKYNPKIKFLKWDKKFNYSAVNNFGVRNTNGEYVLLLNNDTEIITPNWVENMLEHAQRKEIGAVGVKLLYPNDTIQHAGIVLGINGGTGKGVAGHAFKYLPREIQGFPIQKDIIRNYSAVTAACLMIKKDKYLEMKGMNEKFRVAFNDVDFGIRLFKAGYYNLYTPFVELYHHESISVGRPEENTRDIKEFSKEIDMMYKKWETQILQDPFFNTNLDKSSESFLIKI